MESPSPSGMAGGTRPRRRRGPGAGRAALRPLPGRRLRRRSACVGLRPTLLDLLGVVFLVTLGVEVLLVIVGFLAAVVFAVAVDGGLESAEERLLVVGRHLGEGIGAVGEGSTPRRPTKKRLHSGMEPE